MPPLQKIVIFLCYYSTHIWKATVAQFHSISIYDWVKDVAWGKKTATTYQTALDTAGYNYKLKFNPINHGDKSQQSLKCFYWSQFLSEE